MGFKARRQSEWSEGYRPIRMVEFRGADSGDHDQITRAMKREGVEVTKNFIDDPLRYYRHKYPELEEAGTTPGMFVALCKMNEFLATHAEPEIIRIESIMEGDVLIDDGLGSGDVAAVGLRVLFR